VLLDSCSKEDVTGLLFVFVSQGLSLILKTISFTSRENISITREHYVFRKKFFVLYDNNRRKRFSEDQRKLHYVRQFLYHYNQLEITCDIPFRV
jgi:hypothetical protein